MLQWLQNIITVDHPYLTGVILIILVAYCYVFRNRCNLPGPWGLPIVGYLPFLGPRPYETFTKLGKAYGDIYQLRFGPKTTIVLNSISAVTEAYGSNLAFAGRPDIVSLQTFANSGPARFAFRPANETWKFLRRVAARSLGLFASSRNSKLEALVHESHKTFESEVEKHLGKPYNPKEAVVLTVSTVIGSVLFGLDFDQNHPLIRSLVDLVPKVSKFLQVGSAVDNVPFARYIFQGRIKEFLDTFEPVNQLTEKYIKMHDYQGTEDDVRDVADALAKVAEEISIADMKAHKVDRVKIKFIASDLFGAGFATTMDSFRWFLNLMAYNPDVQEKFQVELDNYLQGRQVTLDDKGRNAYIDATITELFRFSSLIPFGLPHAIMWDTKFRGYDIPKGALVFANLYGIHYNPETFPEPQKLKPERFIKQDGTYNAELAINVMPFATGKRRCVGESLARQELFLLLVNTLQKYTVKLAPGQQINIRQVFGGFTRTPHDWEMIFSKRPGY